jgi:hypothetical protein
LDDKIKCHECGSIPEYLARIAAALEKIAASVYQDQDGKATVRIKIEEPRRRG